MLASLEELAQQAMPCHGLLHEVERRAERPHRHGEIIPRERRQYVAPQDHAYPVLAIVGVVDRYPRVRQLPGLSGQILHRRIRRNVEHHGPRRHDIVCGHIVQPQDVLHQIGFERQDAALFGGKFRHVSDFLLRCYRADAASENQAGRPLTEPHQRIEHGDPGLKRYADRPRHGPVVGHAGDLG